LFDANLINHLAHCCLVLKFVGDFNLKGCSVITYELQVLLKQSIMLVLLILVYNMMLIPCIIFVQLLEIAQVPDEHVCCLLSMNGVYYSVP
jgi:hypothetical protein